MIRHVEKHLFRIAARDSALDDHRLFEYQFAM
jgi:hypothetical protein